MPGQDDINSPADRTRDDGKERARLSRRSVLRGAAGAGAAGIAATALAGTAMPAFAAASRPAHDPKDRAQDTDTPEQFVVHVRDARSGESDRDVIIRVSRASGSPGHGAARPAQRQ